MSIMQQTPEDHRRLTILAAAFDIVMRYGFKRTTMDDIARQAGMSRPALYLFYKNKTEIFRACVSAFMLEMQQEVAACFLTAKPPLDQVTDALIAGIVAPMRKLTITPHGAEIFDLKYELAKDLGDQWMQAIQDEICKGMEAAAKAGKLDLTRSGQTEQDFACLLVDSAEGMKLRTLDPDRLEDRLRQLARLVLAPWTM
jgi:AcrR family transcriptional regulator